MPRFGIEREWYAGNQRKAASYQHPISILSASYRLEPDQARGRQGALVAAMVTTARAAFASIE